MANERFKGQSEQHNQGLDHKKALIDQTLVTVKKEIEQVKSGLQTIESNHQKRLGNGGFAATSPNHATVDANNNRLKRGLGQFKTRGQWGERMAEDVLRFSGFVEGINYVKQTAQHDGIPDFTFFLKDKKVNMDVKFPLNNYISYLNDDNETSRETAKKQFIKDVRHHIKTITSRSYISNETVDYVMIFIPNEQIYQFMHDNDPELIDFSLQQKVVLCSPITLYAMLAVMRQAVDHFAIENKAKEMMAILANFQDQWDKYKVSMEKIGKRLGDAQKEYDHLISTRTNQLDRPLKKMEELKSDSMLSPVKNL